MGGMKPQLKGPKALLAVVLLGIGLVVFVVGAYLETRNPRTNDEDDVAWRVLGVSAFLIGTGAGLLFVGPIKAIMIGVVSPFIGFWLMVAIVWSFILIHVIIRNVFG